MFVVTNQIVYGPGRFVAAGTTVDLPDLEAHQLVNENKAKYLHPPYGIPPEAATESRLVESAAKGTGPENAAKQHSPPAKRQGKQ